MNESEIKQINEIQNNLVKILLDLSKLKDTQKSNDSFPSESQLYLSNVEFTAKVIDMILEGTINNYLGKSSTVVEFDSILSFAKYLNVLNSQLLEQIEILKSKL